VYVDDVVAYEETMHKCAECVSKEPINDLLRT